MVYPKWLKHSNTSAKCCLVVVLVLLQGCMGSIWTAGGVIYDRHTFYKKTNDVLLIANVNRALYRDKMFKREDCAIEAAAMNGDLLLVGHVPTVELRREVEVRINSINGRRRLFNQIEINDASYNSVKDSWITAKIRSEILANADIDPKMFKVITSNQIVYLMGDVIPSQAAQVIQMARHCKGVRRVVKLFKYFNLSDHPTNN